MKVQLRLNTRKKIYKSVEIEVQNYTSTGETAKGAIIDYPD